MEKEFSPNRRANPGIRFRIQTRRVAAIVAAVLISGSFAIADGGTEHQADQRNGDNASILMGTTGGNIFDITAFCCAGTLGAVVTADGVDHVLSNNHVLARTNLGQAGDSIIHPGLIDQAPACFQDFPDAIATLSRFVEIGFRTRGKFPQNTVDAAIAVVTNTAVSAQILDIGGTVSTTAAAQLEQPVRKSGRTTGDTMGTVMGINAMVRVNYNTRCGQGRKTAVFVGQIEIRDAAFGVGGDSGSLVVEGDVATSPAAVGLLFASGSTSAFANPIGEVLDCLDATLGATVGVPMNCTHSAVVVASDNVIPASGRAVPPGLEAAAAVQARHSAALFSTRGVVGHALGRDENGNPVIRVYLDSAARDARNPLPRELDGIPVRPVVTGPIIAN